MLRLLRHLIPIAAGAVIALFLGLWSGLLRLGAPLSFPEVAPLHGPLMVVGFLGTLIGLERAVALKRPWGFACPALSAGGVFFLILSVPLQLSWRGGAVLFLLSALVLCAIYLETLRLQPEGFVVVQALGALLLLLGDVAWLGGPPVSRVVDAWIGFLLLTILGERIELSRMTQRTAMVGRIAVLLGVGVSLVSAGAVFGSRDVSALSAVLLGGLWVAVTFWFAGFDVSLKTVRMPGLTRYIAVSLLSGMVWLGVAGVGRIFFFEHIAGPLYDLTLHAFFVGFVFSMIFGHAPVIGPAVFGVRMKFSRRFYLHLIVLHGGLFFRVVGDLMGHPEVRAFGGWMNVAGILLFLANMILSIERKTKNPRRRT